ncbi:SnoaL-like domain-containing protein [Persephonella hydrogeniphila]|uniref:SnoaL-like domain-containing protein n=1 Tax=Persephonella hydrogeniphila TaxID=198703 RepID=A0A285N4S1_9AQUI|nr:nuclear transport factor 2 family protein [Persephonella hydrogeniphila]SNZ02986.1 SnoaL-like domain-containing protein [Persephonella hydrogeniphila]
MTKSPIQQTVDSWIDGWNEHNIDKIIENYAETAELYDPKIKELYPETLTLVGKENIKKYYEVVLKLFPEIKIKPLGLWIKNHEALLEYYVYTQKDAKADVISKFYMNRENKIQGHFVYYGLSYKEIEEVNNS